MASRIISMDMVLKLADSGFETKLIKNALANLQQEIRTLVSGYRSGNKTQYVEDYEEEKSWLDCYLNE